MNKLKKAAGLLNDEAPKGEFLAYINPKEAGLLSSKGGAGIDINNSGVPSFYGSDDYGSGEDGRGGSSNSSSDSSGSNHDDTGNANNTKAMQSRMIRRIEWRLEHASMLQRCFQSGDLV